MASWLTTFLNSAAGRWCGVPQATPLIRPAGETQCFTGSVLLCGKTSEISSMLRQHLTALPQVFSGEHAEHQQLQAIIFDGTALQGTNELDLVWQQLHQQLPRLANNGRVIVLARSVQQATNADAAAAAAALSGFTRSIAKELGRFGSTANLISAEQGALQSLLPVVEFFYPERQPMSQARC